MPGVAGTWKDLTDRRQLMAGNLTAQVRNIADVATAIAGATCRRRSPSMCRAKSFSSRKPSTRWWTSSTPSPARSPAWRARVGTEGRLGGQANVLGVAGTWKDLTDSVNSMAGNLTGQVRNIAEVTTAVANGDLSKKITVDVRGEILELKDTINTMVDQLNAFAGEVTPRRPRGRH